tara:strand:+ start:399 stop:629 length:231 start_codon:yes stop_codon:yes gene_type:complete
MKKILELYTEYLDLVFRVGLLIIGFMVIEKLSGWKNYREVVYLWGIPNDISPLIKYLLIFYVLFWFKGFINRKEND